MSGTDNPVPGQTTSFDHVAYMQHINTIVSNLQQQVNDHAAVIQELSQLRTENADLKQRNAQLEADMAKLREQLAQTAAPRDSDLTAPPTTVSTVANTVNTTSTTSYAAKAAANVPVPPNGGKKRTTARNGNATTKRQRIAAARAFRTPEKQGPQGFEFVYLGRSRRIDRRETRSRLRRAGVDTSRVLDISFPATGVIGILLHTQYAQAFKDIMTRSQAEIIDSFDPLDPKHLADPQYATLSEAARADELAQLVLKRCKRTLGFVRPHIVGHLSAYFESLGWISEDDTQQGLRLARRRLKETNARQAAFVFKGIDTASEDDSDFYDASGSDMSE